MGKKERVCEWYQNQHIEKQPLHCGGLESHHMAKLP